MLIFRLPLLCAFCLLLSRVQTVQASGLFSVATYNLENYLAEPAGDRAAKSEAAKAVIRASIRALNPEVLAIEEMGGTDALLELRSSLKSEGFDFPYWEYVAGFDTNIHVAILSRFLLTARRPHTNDSFLLNGRRFRVGRGFAEVDVQVNGKYHFTLLAAHLKSRRKVPEADEAELREQEAIAFRRVINARLAADPRANLVVVGDLNDLKDSRPVRTIIGRGKGALIDVRPAEQNGGTPGSANNSHPVRNVTWTYFYGKEDTYSRIDYIMLSQGMARELQKDGTYVLAMPNWGEGSDHRPVIARFIAVDR